MAALRGELWQREVRFFSGAAGLALLYALGWYTPVFKIIYELVPGVQLFRRPADATFLAGGWYPAGSQKAVPNPIASRAA